VITRQALGSPRRASHCFSVLCPAPADLHYAAQGRPRPVRRPLAESPCSSTDARYAERRRSHDRARASAARTRLCARSSAAQPELPVLGCQYAGAAGIARREHRRHGDGVRRVVAGLVRGAGRRVRIVRTRERPGARWARLTDDWGDSCALSQPARGSRQGGWLARSLCSCGAAAAAPLLRWHSVSTAASASGRRLVSCTP
jgi:hypothetical protein